VQATDIALWMQEQLDKEGCLYQDDVVDMLVKTKNENYLRENSDGNQVLATTVLNHFKGLNELTVVWVRSEQYWRFRVKEDELSRNAIG
jgi:hypothetical protein